MSDKTSYQAAVDHYGSQYSNFATELFAEIRRKAMGEDIGQNGWLTADEQDIFIDWLGLDAEAHLLDIACGCGGPTLRIDQHIGCQVTGVDIQEQGIAQATTYADQRGLFARGLEALGELFKALLESRFVARGNERSERQAGAEGEEETRRGDG